MIDLAGPQLRARVSADRGEVRSLRRADGDEELLFQSPWPTAPPAGAAPDPVAWTRAWPGGWTLLFPNAGEPCTVDGRAHGFHGDASLARWDVVAAGDDVATLRWADPSGLEIERRFAAADDALTVDSTIRNTASHPLPYLQTEHLILGERLAGPGAEITLGGGRMLRMDDTGQPLGELESWPTAEDWRTAPADPFSRFAGIEGIERSEVVVEREGIRATVTWAGLPGLWFWHEHRASPEFPGATPITCLGVEPASSLRSDGLEEAIRRGDATILEPGAQARASVALSVARVAPGASA